MDISTLNSFFETANQVRIKSGVLQTASFEINVASGRASGNVRAIYRDLHLAVINEHTGSEKGFFDGISSFYVNTVKIRGNNVPDKSGSMKIGEVKYTRKRNDPFLQFAVVRTSQRRKRCYHALILSLPQTAPSNCTSSVPHPKRSFVGQNRFGFDTL